MLLALMSLAPLVLSRGKLRIKRSSSLVKRKTASLKGYGGLREPVNKCSLGCESAEDSESEVGNLGLGLVLPSEAMFDARRSDKMCEREARFSQTNQITQGTGIPEAIDGLIEGIESQINGTR